MSKENKQRTIVELLELLKDFYKDIEIGNMLEIKQMMIWFGRVSSKEGLKLQNYLQENNPKKPFLDWINAQIKIEREKERKKEETYIVITSSICELEVSYEIVNGKRTKQIIETGTTYQEKKL